AVFAWIPGFWMLPTLTLSREAAAASIGFINAVGNIGGFLGPFLTGLLRYWGQPRLASALVIAIAYVGSAALTWRIAIHNRSNASTLQSSSADNSTLEDG